jgi:hypothetical protein
VYKKTIAYPAPTIRHLLSPAMKKSLFSNPPSSSPFHENFAGFGSRLKTKVSPVPKYVRLFCPLFLSLQDELQYAPTI